MDKRVVAILQEIHELVIALRLLVDEEYSLPTPDDEAEPTPKKTGTIIEFHKPDRRMRNER